MKDSIFKLKKLSFLKKYRFRIILLLLAPVILIIMHYHNEYLFNKALIEAAKIDPTSWDKAYENNAIRDKYKVVFITCTEGEYSYAEYFKYEAEKMGWEVKIYYHSSWVHEDDIISFDPDFMLFTLYNDSFISTKIKAHKSKKYLTSFASFQGLRDEWDHISKEDPYEPRKLLKSYIENTHGILSVTKELDIYKTMFTKLNKQFNGLQLLPLVPETYSEVASPKTLMWVSCTWDKYRSSKHYKNFIKLLSENVPMKIYGGYNASSYIAPGVYDGIMAPGMDNIHTIRKNGIYLLTHSDWHFKGGEPNMRGFEASSAGAIVISDKHPFIVEHFGDSFLYFDHDVDAQNMYEQVKKHMDWIKNNPEKAKAIAEKANKIYREKFILKKDLIRIAKMHEGVLAQEKAMGLSQPLSY